MKNFFKYTLATLLGCLIFAVLGIFLLFGIASAIVSSTEKTTTLEPNSVLKINLGYAIVERGTNDPFEAFESLGIAGIKKTGLDDVLSALDKASQEDNIKGIVLHIGEVQAGYASLKEIRDALVDFKKESDKFIYSYSESYSQKGYYLASVSDKIFITPEGSLDIHGLASQSMYYKNLLDKLGIEMQIIRHGKFKSAVEPYMSDKMSLENREQISTYIGSIWSTLSGEIQDSRSGQIINGTVDEIADMGINFCKTDLLKEKGLVDYVGYEDQFLDTLRNAIAIDKEAKIPFVSIDDLKLIPEKREGKRLSKNKIAVIYASGDIVMESLGLYSSGEEIVGNDLAREIRAARLDTTIKAIVLRVNSPGGSALASELIWRETMLAKQSKPFVVSMGDYAASGGYYISCAADKIIAQPTTVTGSIGVFGMIPNTQRLFENKLGITTETVKTNALSDFPSTSRGMTKEEADIVLGSIENVYNTFVGHVADGRNMNYDEVDAIGQGRVWTGSNALELGLVDSLGGLDVAISVAQELAKLDSYRIVKLPKQKDPIEELLNTASTIKANMIEKELGSSIKYYKMIESINNCEGIMTRIPYGLDLN